MRESDDFIVEGGTEDGFTIVREICAGGIIFNLRDNVFVMQSKTGALNSFYAPKGHLKIIDDYAEDIFSCAERETREELYLDDDVVLTFNAFHFSQIQNLKFIKSKERAFKRIQYFGYFCRDMLEWDTTLPNSYLRRALSFDEIQRYAKPQLLDMLMIYKQHLNTSISDLIYC